MKVCLWAMGSPSDQWIQQGEQTYSRRIGHYLPFEYKCIQVSKSNTPPKVLAEESKWLSQQFQAIPSHVILLDEKGPSLTSIAFANKLETWRLGSHKRVIFIIGSAYGFDPMTYDAAHGMLSLSPMTLPHQLCRLLMLEQLYRACTILRGESYHHA